jgi:hypothetical protein
MIDLSGCYRASGNDIAQRSPPKSQPAAPAEPSPAEHARKELDRPYIKYCSESLRELDEWARKKVGGPGKRCSRHQP